MKDSKAIWITIIIITILIIGGYFYYKNTMNSWNLKKASVNSIQLKQSDSHQLSQDYTTYGNTEFAYCLYGDIQNNKAIITSIKPSQMLSESNFVCEKSIFSELFSTKLIGTIHSHPSGICSLSETDIFTFGKSDDAVISIICGTNNFNFFTQNDLISSITLEVI